MSSGGPHDLVAFAKNLVASGTQLWSTRQFNTEAVEQRAAFEDGAEYLPFNEVFDDTGVATAAAETAGVSAANTWIFPDGSMATGALSVEDISTRSGVAIPGKVNPFLADLDDVTLTSESPLNIALNGYDAAGQPLTYTVTTDNPTLLDTSIVEGNRSWV